MLLDSVTAAIQNPMLLGTLEEIGGKKAATPKRGDIQDVVVAQAKLYRGPNGEMGWPMDNLMATLCNGGKHISVKKGKRTSAITKSGGGTEIPSIVTFTKRFYAFKGLDANGEVATEALPMGEEEAKANTPWEVHAGRTVNQQTKGSNRTVRPLIPKWACEIEFTFKDPDFSDDTVLQLWQKAGEKSGLGDWRGSAPNKPGSYGQFRVSKFEVIKIEPINDDIEIKYVGQAEKHAPKTEDNGRMSSKVLEKRVAGLSPAPVATE